MDLQCVFLYISGAPEDIKPAVTGLDFSDYLRQAPSLSDAKKMSFIKLRQPETSYQFPSKEYKDKRTMSGIQRRYCQREYFNMFDFIMYSKKMDGLYCLACTMFPVKPDKGSVAKLMISSPYRNWKDCRSDLSSHATLRYHQSAMAKLQMFQSTMENPDQSIRNVISTDSSETVKRNREVLTSLLHIIELCGKQGIALRGHRDDGISGDCDFTNKGNFRALVELCASRGDKILENHLCMGSKNATYLSKTAQNELLVCIKDYIQEMIVEQIKSQTIGPHYAIMADEVTDAGNWEQLGIVVRYLVDNGPQEKLLQFNKCDSVTGDAISSQIIDSLNTLGLDPSHCRAQTYDGAGNMAGSKNGAAKKFQEKTANHKAVYLHCASHCLNLVLNKASGIPEFLNMVDCLKELSLFFKKSPKNVDFWRNV